MASATNDDGGSVSSSVSINTRLIKIITGSRAILLFPALFLLVGLTVAAMRQPLRADPYQGGEFFSLSWWLHPYERNSNNRLCAIQSNLNAVYALPDASFVWVAGTGGLVACSSDQGGTWRQKKVDVIGSKELMTVFFLDALNGFVTATTDVGTTDGGDSWEDDTPDLGERGSGFSGSDQTDSINVTQSGHFWWVAHGSNEVSVSAPDSFLGSGGGNQVRGSEALYAVYGASPTTGWVGGTRGLVFKTTDAGKTWQQQMTRSGEIIRALWFLSEGQRGWAAGEHGALQYTEDGGETWTPQNSNTNTMLSAIFFLEDGLRGWVVGTSGVILHTEDGGKHWFHQTREIDLNATTIDQSRPWHFLPPWYFLSLVLPVCLGYLALRPARTDLEEEETVADLFISDRPLEPGDADPMDFRTVALGLSRFLRNEKTLPPLTIAITGEWGTGKSSLMNLLRADLREFGFQPVWFNAWHHQKEEHLLASLLQNIRLQAIPPWWRPEGLIFRTRLLAIRGWRRLLPLLLLLIVIAALTGYVLNQPFSLSDMDLAKTFESGGLTKILEAALKFGPFLTLVGTIAAGLRKGLTAFGVKPASLMSSGSGKLSVSDLEAQTSFRQRFSVQFQDVTRALNPRTMIVFVDDLDRCRPENVLEVLEAINFLVSSGDCFIVMGMARERVERCVGLGFKDIAEEMMDDTPVAQKGTPEINKGRSKRSEFAKQYLDKLINIEVPVPAPTSDQLRQLLLPGSTPERSRNPLSAVAVFAVRLWPLMLIASFVVMGFLFGKSFTSKQVRPSETSTQTDAGPGPPVERPQVVDVEPSRLGTSLPSLRSPQTSDRPPAELIGSQLPSRMPEYWLAILIGLSVIGAGLWFLTRPLGVVVKDSPGFVRALDIWHPVVATRRKTPRSLKRFTNRVRYLAMRQRPRRRGRSLLQTLSAFVEGRISGDERGIPATMTLIPESSLVAMCVMDSFDPDLVRSDKLWRIQESWRDSTMKSPRTNEEKELEAAIEKHLKEFESWPTDKERRIYLEITAGLRVN